MLQFDDVSLRRGPRLLFEEASFRINAGHKVGLTGANGSGKTSMLSLLTGELVSDRGNVTVPPNWRIAHVAQEAPISAQSTLDYVLDGDTRLRLIQKALAEAEQREDGESIAHLHAELEHAGGYQAESRASSLLNGLGFSNDDTARPVSEFSGGWRMRLTLARALMSGSELLLLDEPTNHLDLDAVIWLEGWLKGYQGALIMISHDRAFLDGVCSHILHIEQRHVTLSTGNYSEFESLRAARLATQQAAYAQQQREIAHMQHYIDRFRAKATKARQAQSRLKALERLPRIAPAHVDSPFHFSFSEPDKNPHPLLQLTEAAAGYAGKPIVDNVDLTLNPGDRVGLLGPNGAGKSTLIRLLAGMLEPLRGERSIARHLLTGYFAQHQFEQLHAERSALAHIQDIDGETSEQALRDYLGGFGFAGDRALEEIAPFSGGEKSRLVLAMLVYQRPNLLLLDEPTNHLDIEMRQALANALQDFAGAMVIVSHDRHLLGLTCDSLMLVDRGRVEEFPEDLDSYPAWLAARRREASTTGMPAVTTLVTDRKARRRNEAEQRRLLQPLKQALQRAERELEERQAKLEELNEALADNSLYQAGEQQQLQALLARKRSADAALNAAESAWLAAAEALEQAAEDAR